MKNVDTNVNSDNHLRKNTKDDKVHSQKINLKFQTSVQNFMQNSFL